MPTAKLAFDRTSRRLDADGRLHVARSHISKAAVNPYYGREIPGYDQLGLAPDKIYKLLRDPAELERAAETFARLPILSQHVHVTVDDPRPDLVIGSVGSEVAFDAPYLDADLCFWDPVAIAGIDSAQIQELSSAYRYTPVMDPGEFEGVAYDGRMTEIKGSHLALVEVGRAGPDVVVADQNPFITPKESAMKKTKLGAALFAALSLASPVLAADSALAKLVGQAKRENFKKDDIKAKLLAMDSDLEESKLDNMIDSMLEAETDPSPKVPETAKDEGPCDKVRMMLEGKVDPALIEEICAMMAPVAEDETPEPGMSKEEVTAAMDSMRAELREAADAAREVRSVVGDVIGMDSAAEVYGFALDHLKVDRKGVEGVPALRAMFKIASSQAVRQSVTIAGDSAAMAERFPAANRFRSV